MYSVAMLHLLHPLPCMLGYYVEIQIIFGTVYKDNGHDNLDLFNLKFWIKISVTIFYNLKIILQKLLIKKSRNLSSSCQKNLFSILIFTQFVAEQERKHGYSFLIWGHCGSLVGHQTAGDVVSGSNSQWSWGAARS